jgi:hypothetical protein
LSESLMMLGGKLRTFRFETVAGFARSSSKQKVEFEPSRVSPDRTVN